MGMGIPAGDGMPMPILFQFCPFRQNARSATSPINLTIIQMAHRQQRESRAEFCADGLNKAKKLVRKKVRNGMNEAKME
jgi:hypothetical protein